MLAPLGLATGLATAGVSAPPNQIDSVHAYELPTGRTEIRIELARQPDSLDSYRILAPVPKIVLDIPGARRHASQRRVEYVDGVVDKLSLHQHERGVRVVVDLEIAAGYRAFIEGSGVTILVQPAHGLAGL